MIENVIVTIQVYNSKMDMELPAKIAVNVVCEKILEALKEIDDTQFMRYTSLYLRCADATLNGEETLYDQGIFDGSILNVELK